MHLLVLAQLSCVPVSNAAEADPSVHTVTVFIPAYNGADYIAEAIESSLQHDYPPHEVIVTDDCSTDATAEIVGCYPDVKLLRHQTNRGQAAARNTAIAAASGVFVASLDQDDRHLPGRLRRRLRRSSRNPGAVACAGPSQHFREEGERAPELAPEWKPGPGGELPGLASDAAKQQPVFSTLLFRRSASDREVALRRERGCRRRP